MSLSPHGFLSSCSLSSLPSHSSFKHFSLSSKKLTSIPLLSFTILINNTPHFPPYSHSLIFATTTSLFQLFHFIFILKSFLYFLSKVHDLHYQRCNSYSCPSFLPPPLSFTFFSYTVLFHSPSPSITDITLHIVVPRLNQCLARHTGLPHTRLDLNSNCP